MSYINDEYVFKIIRDEYETIKKNPTGIKKFENKISKEPITSYVYARYFIHKRFLQGEKSILRSNKDMVMKYITDIIRGKWPEGEHKIAKVPSMAFEYAVLTNDRFLLGEPYIANKSLWAFRYATEILKREWPEGEDGISQGIENSYYYAKFIGKRFHKGEPTIMKSPIYAFHYAKNIMKERWVDAEVNIEKNEQFHKYYLRFLELLGQGILVDNSIID
ncbi:MAG: hypothetical protein WCJ72_15585 [Chryseobacterium sp.]|jgi:hypothetical protein